MAKFALPKNSRIVEGKVQKAPSGAQRVKAFIDATAICVRRQILAMPVVHGVCGSGEIVLLLKLFGGPEVR